MMKESGENFNLLLSKSARLNDNLQCEIFRAISLLNKLINVAHGHNLPDVHIWCERLPWKERLEEVKRYVIRAKNLFNELENEQNDERI